MDTTHRSWDAQDWKTASTLTREGHFFRQDGLHHQIQQWVKQQAANAQLSKRHYNLTMDRLHQTPTTSIASRQLVHLHAARSRHHQDPSRYTQIDASTASRQVQQQQGCSAFGNGSTTPRSSGWVVGSSQRKSERRLLHGFVLVSTFGIFFRHTRVFLHLLDCPANGFSMPSHR